MQESESTLIGVKVGMEPHDHLWVAVLLRDNRFEGMSDDQIREYLAGCGCPKHLTERYLVRKREEEAKIP